MYTKAAVTSPRLLVGVAAVLCTLFVASVAAGEKIVTVSRHVSTEGLDLSQPADLRTFYTRLENAAWVVCTRADRVNLVRVENFTVCYEKALAGAIRAARTPALTQIYLATHTAQAAAAQGIEIPAQVVAK
jgi:UrcA family protein